MSASAAPAAPAASRRAGLPGRLAARLRSPLVAIEVAAAFRRKRFVVAFTVSLLVLVAVLLVVLAATIGEPPPSIGQAIFIAFLVAIAVVAAFLFPAFSCTSIVEEKVNRSLDLLLVTRLSPFEIFAGKLLGSLIYCAMFLVGALPVVALSFLFGGVEPSAIVFAYVLALLWALLICTIGTYASATARTSGRAVVIAYLLHLFVGFLTALAAVPLIGYWLGRSTGVLSGDLIEIERLFQQGGDLVYGGFAWLFLAAVAFFAIAGTNRLKPAAYDRSTSMRALTLLALGGLAFLYAAAMRRTLALGGAPPDLFAGLAAAAALLSAAVLLGLAAEARFGLGVAAGRTFSDRGAVAHRDLALVLLSFLAFLAAFGRLLAEYARGHVGPRLAVAGLAVVLLLGPFFLLVAEEEGRMSAGAEPPPASTVPAALSRGYFLSPILSGVSAVSLPAALEDRPRYFLRPGAFDVGRGDLFDANGRPHATSPVAALERRAIPLHLAGTVFYFALAALLFALGARRARKREGPR